MQLVTKRAELELGRSYWAFPKDKRSGAVKIHYKRLGENMLFSTPGRMCMVTETFEIYELVGPIEPETPPILELYKKKYYNPPQNLCQEVVLPHSGVTVHLKPPVHPEPRESNWDNFGKPTPDPKPNQE